MAKSFHRSSRRNVNKDTVKEIDEIVEIERTPIEQGLLNLKHTLQKNIHIVRYSIFLAIAVLLLVLLILMIHSLRVESHSKQLFSLLTRLQIAETQEARNSLLKESNQLCETSWSTYVSRNACLISSVILRTDKKYNDMISFLEKFNSASNKKVALPITLFYQALAYEKNENLEKAQSTFKKLETYLKKSDNEDIAVFHQARIFYRKKNFSEAQNLFSTLAKNKESNYSEESKKYLILIAAQKNLTSSN